MKFRCLTHKIEVDKKEGRRVFSGIYWSGSPQCALMTLKEPSEGVWGECKIREE